MRNQMRNQMKSSRPSMAIAVALGILVMTLAAPAFAVTPTIAVVGTSVNGGVVNVTVKNVSSLPQVATVSVQAVVNDTPIWSLVPVMLNAGQSATVSAGFTGVVSSVSKVGITVDMSDDGTPF